MSSNAKLTAIPTHIVTGFLGVGKTTAILNLLQFKPDNERWAILVNEFGDVGIDGALLKSQQMGGDSVYIREVPGGCMCCAAGVPMQVALNQLLKHAKPDRLIIEPTGLGHPKQVLKALQAEHYQHVLAIEKVVTLVDARKLNQEKYTQHPIFNDQLAIADCIVGTKSELYEEGDAQRLIAYVQQKKMTTEPVMFIERGQLALADIIGATKHSVLASPTVPALRPVFRSMALQQQPNISVINTQLGAETNDGYTSIGWQFPSTFVFNRQRVVQWLQSLMTEQRIQRLKAVLTTTEGCFAYNIVENEMTETKVGSNAESRLEIIAEVVEEHWLAQLQACGEQTQQQ